MAYADFVTAMMAFFLVMWLVGQSEGDEGGLAGYFRDPGVLEHAHSTGDPPRQHDRDRDVRAAADAGAADAEGRRDRPGRARAERPAHPRHAGKLPDFEKLKGQIEIQATPDGMRIELIDSSDGTFFDNASAVLKPPTERILAVIGRELSTLGRPVVIEGHTDSRPYNNVGRLHQLGALGRSRERGAASDGADRPEAGADQSRPRPGGPSAREPRRRARRPQPPGLDPGGRPCRRRRGSRHAGALRYTASRPPVITRFRMVQDSIAVLLVEDDTDYARVVSQTVATAAAAWVVVHVTALAPALERLAHGRFDAVLLDLGLPDSGGLDTLAAIARAVPALPIVVLTAPADEDLSRAALLCGAHDYVVKGDAEPDRIVHALRHAIERRQAIGGVERRLRLLSEASALLESGDYDTMLDRVARLVVGAFAELCVMVRLNAAGFVDQVHLAHASVEQDRLLHALADSYRDATTAIPSEYLPAILAGRSAIIDAGDERIARRFLPSDDALDTYRRFDLGSAMLVPIAAGGVPSGVMLVASSRLAAAVRCDRSRDRGGSRTSRRAGDRERASRARGA